jgi:hypothetical protein
VISVSPADLQAVAGHYEPQAPRNQLFVFMDQIMGGFDISAGDASLVTKGLFGKPKTLYPVGKNLFRGEKDPEATSVFFAGPDGENAYSAAGSVDGMLYGVRISPIWPYARLVLLCVSAILMASAILFAIVWILLWVFRKMKRVQYLSVRVVPLLAVLTFIAIPFAFPSLIGGMGEKNFGAVVVYAATILFPILGVIGVILALRVPKAEISRGVRIHSLLVSLACCVVAMFLASWHLLGLRVWVP